MRLTYQAKKFPFIARHLTYKIAVVQLKTILATYCFFNLV